MKPTENALLAVLKQYGKALAKRPAGEGWYTLEELARQDKTTRAAIKYRIVMAQRRGIQVATATGSAVDDEGNVKRATYYKLLRNGKP